MVHQVSLRITAIGTDHIRIMQHVHDGTGLLVLLHHLRMLLQHLQMFCPRAMEERVFQYFSVLIHDIHLIGHQAAARQIFQVLRTPPKLYASLNTHVVTVVQHAVMIVYQVAYDHRCRRSKGRRRLFRTVGIAVHLRTLTTQSRQSQISHQRHRSRRHILLLVGLL